MWNDDKQLIARLRKRIDELEQLVVDQRAVTLNMRTTRDRALETIERVENTVQGRACCCARNLESPCEPGTCNVMFVANIENALHPTVTP